MSAQVATECICTDWCPEDFGDEHYCRYCGGLDIYDPCPRVGFGCGANGNTDRCDCCSAQQLEPPDALVSDS